MKKQLLNLLVLFLVFACSKDDSDGKAALSDQKQMVSFKFLSSENETLLSDVTATINETNRTVSVEVPAGTDITSLKPVISSSALSTVTPNDKLRLDFTDPILYSVEAEDGSTQIYTVTVTVAKNNQAQILSFNILMSVNSDGSKATDIYKDITATIDQDNKTISLTIFEESLEAGLTPTIILSDGATLTPDQAETLNEDSTYTVTSEDGTATETYSLIISRSVNERKILIDFFNANPNNTLGWNINSLNIENWSGLTFFNERVSKIEFINKNIENFTPEISKLQGIFELIIQNQNAIYKLSALPVEIGNMVNLKTLFLSGNALTELPAEIGNLVNLDRLVVDENQLTKLPAEIGNISNMKWLIVNNNKLTQLPDSIGNLVNLTELFINDNELSSLPDAISGLDMIKVLRLKNNRLAFVPDAIAQMNSLVNIDLTNNNLYYFPDSILNVTKLNTLIMDNNHLSTVPTLLGNMNSLEKFSISNNNLSSVPSELSNLSKLKTLNLVRNSLKNIPQPVCDMESAYGTQIYKDNKAKCG